MFRKKINQLKNIRCKHSRVLFLIFFQTVLGVFFCIHTCSLIWWHLQSDAFVLQLVWCSSFLHLLHAGSLQLAWLPQFAQYKFSFSNMSNQKLHESSVCIFVLKIDFLTYIITSYWHIRYKKSGHQIIPRSWVVNSVLPCKNANSYHYVTNTMPT